MTDANLQTYTVRNVNEVFGSTQYVDIHLPKEHLRTYHLSHKVIYLPKRHWRSTLYMTDKQIFMYISKEVSK